MRHRSPARWIAAATLFVAGSCAPASPGGLHRPDAPFDAGRAEGTLAYGLASIAEQYLDPISLADVAFEGMRGLAGIDPDIGFRREGDWVLLTAADRLVAKYPAPAPHNADDWARLAITAALDARSASKAMHEAEGEAVLEAVFDAALARLDLFSRYYGAREAPDIRAGRNGFGGLGIRFDMVEGLPKLIEVMDETPARDAGLAVGDVIARVDGLDILGLERAEISKRLRGPTDSEVLLTLRRGGEEIGVALRRALIMPPTIFASFDEPIGTFRITGFNQRTASALAQGIVRMRADHGSRLGGVVLDLRGNPGGLLDQAVSMADLFIAQGGIVSTRGRHPHAGQSYDAKNGDIAEDLPVAVLIDGKSASAAEILAAALQDSGRAVVIGTNSYGKGTVQKVIRMPNDGEMALTWSRFHAPSGYALQGLGVLPTLCTADETAESAALILAGTGPAAQTAANLSAWRAVGIDDSEARASLRRTCPAATHANSALDSQIARRLLADPTLFGRALAVSAPPPTPISAALPAAQQAAGH